MAYETKSSPLRHVAISTKDGYAIDHSATMALYHAAHDRTLLELLMKRGAEPGLKHLLTRTPYVFAERIRAYNTLRLIDPGEATDGLCLRLATSAGDTALVKRFLSDGLAIDAPDASGETPLFKAAYPETVALYHGHKSLVRLLLYRGANANVTRTDGNTLLHLASRDGREPLVQDLLAHGARHDMRDPDARTPLHLAAFHGRRAVARMLIKAGADVNAADRYGATPLHLAVNPGFQKRPASLVALLLESGSCPLRQDNAGRLPRDYAAEEDEVILELLR